MKLERLAGLGATLALLATMGCSDPVPPPPQASIIFTFTPPAIPGQGCSATGFAHIGGPPHAAQVKVDPRAIDGQDGTSVGCRVSGSGTFSVSGTAQRQATSFVLINGTATAGGEGQARISVASPATASKQMTSPTDNPCTLRFNPPPFQVAPGNMWAQFECPVVTNASSPGLTCGIHGEAVFENCEE